MAQVFVVDRAAFFGGDWPQGFMPLPAGDQALFLRQAYRLGRFVERPLAEANPAWKQWIPYCVLRCGTPGHAPARDPAAGVFVVWRTKGQSEARLHGACSIGIGGHVEPEDGGPQGPVDAAFFAGSLQRELAEELHLEHLPLPAPTLLGLLNDDSTDVGRVHAGLVYCIDLPMPLPQAAAALRIREISKMRGGFTHLVEFEELWQNPPQFESWSQILVRAGIAGPIGGCRTSEASGQGG